MLVICGIYFTFKLNFVQFRMLKEMVRVLMEGKSGAKDQVSPFQAFCIGMAARWNREYYRNCDCNCIRYPGAVFWMWIISIISSTPVLSKAH